MNRFKKACLDKSCGKAEIISFILYFIGVAVIGYFHEPWFDEAQAWQIARCASIKEILFEVPHYEGHPQLWHLILVPFAKLGAPYEFSLFAVNFAFCLAAVALLLWKSPFPKIVRCVIPFTFFFFYQFGVQSRPYSMMMLAIMLISITYTARNQKPGRYILSLMFLCLTSAYGILLAGGLCILWTLEIFAEYQKSRAWGKVFSDKRAYLLFAILLLAIFLICSIMPAKDCYYAGGSLSPLARLKRTFYILILPFDSVIGLYIDVDSEATTGGGLIAECIGGVIFWFVMLCILHANRKKALFLVPYLLYAVFSIYIHYSVHHLGIGTLYMVFTLWIIYKENGTLIVPPLFITIYQKIESGLTRKLLLATGILAAAVSPVCTVVSSVNDILYDFGPRVIADFIKDNNLQDRKIMVMWSFGFDVDEDKDLTVTDILVDETLPVELPAVKDSWPYIMGTGASVSPYFDRNIFMNFNTDDPDCMYMKWIDGGDCETIYKSWHDQGLPDFIIGLVPLNEIYSDEELEGVTYYWIDMFVTGNIWKLERVEGELKIYIRGDLLDEYPQFEVQKYATILTEPIH